MRITHVLTLIGAAAISFSAGAAPGNAGSTAALVAVSAPAMHKVRPDEIKSVVGRYRLDDGRTLLVSSENRKLYIEVGGAKKELLRVAASVFASSDDEINVKFESDGGRYADTVKLVQLVP